MKFTAYLLLCNFVFLNHLISAQINPNTLSWGEYVSIQAKENSKIFNLQKIKIATFDQILNLLNTREEGFKKIARPESAPPKYPENLRAAISFYSIWYDKINTPLRKNQSPSGKAFSFYKILTSQSFTNLLSVEGVVYRGVNLPKEVFKNLSNSKAFQDLAFMSASLRPLGAKAYIENCVSSSTNQCVFMILESKNSKYISYLSDLPGEEEVLFRPKTNFKVIKIIQSANQNAFIIAFLQEI